MVTERNVKCLQPFRIKELKEAGRWNGKGQKEKWWKHRISILIPIPLRLETAKHIPLDSFFKVFK